jgi:hypothetical protein
MFVTLLWNVSHVNRFGNEYILATLGHDLAIEVVGRARVVDARVQVLVRADDPGGLAVAVAVAVSVAVAAGTGDASRRRRKAIGIQDRRECRRML